VTTWDGEDYQRRLDAMAATGADMHGEASFVAAFAPGSVLDAGCGTGRVAIELRRRGVDVLGVDVLGVDSNASMITTARRLDPGLAWMHADMASVDLGRLFDVVLMAGNVPLFTPPGTTAALIAGCARHVAEGGHLVTGFQLDRGYTLDQYDQEAAAAGLGLTERYATWDREPFDGSQTYAVSVHRRV
jgi:SAM-dependent methyltransferase